MDKYDAEVAKAKHASEKVADVFKTIRYLISALLIGFIIWTVMSGLESISTKAHPDAIIAVSKVVEKLALDYWILWIALAATGTTTVTLLYTNKRNIRKIDELRGKLEVDDPERSSSGLDKNGNTPVK